MTPTYLDDLTVSSLLDYASVRQILDEAWGDFAIGQAQAFGRHRIDCESTKFSAMGGIWLTRAVAGMKCYPTIGGKFSFVMNLFDLAENRPLAVMAGGELTRWRTGAMVALVASKAALPQSRKVAVIGLGIQGASIAKALCSSFSLKEFAVVDPAASGLSLSQLGTSTGVYTKITTMEDAIRDADIVVTATRSKTPVFDGSLLKPGAFVAAVGTSLPNGTELDDSCLRRAGRVIVEWKPQSMVEAGEVVLGIASGALSEEKIVDLVDMYRGKTPWRSDPAEIVVFKSVGVGLSDVAAAWLAVRRHRTTRAKV